VYPELVRARVSDLHPFHSDTDPDPGFENECGFVSGYGSGSKYRSGLKA